MHQKVMLFLSWIKKLFQSKKQSTQLETKTSICKICFNEIKVDSFHSLLCKNLSICIDCFVKLEPKFIRYKIGNIKALSVYYYDEVIKGYLYQLKGCFDIELAPLFLDYFKTYFHIKYSGYSLIPAPSYEEKNKEREFNHVVEIFKPLKLPILDLFKKTKNVKQADLSSKERENISQYIHLKSKFDLSNKKILLVDDVYTTGSTIKAMINEIKRLNPRKIEVLTMSKTKDIEDPI